METAVKTREVFRLVDEVNFDPQKVVFTKLLSTEFGAVNLVAFSAGRTIAEHTAPASVTVLVLKGKIIFNVAGQPKTLNEGDALLMEAGVPHSLKAVDDSKMLLVKIDE